MSAEERQFSEEDLRKIEEEYDPEARIGL